MVVTKEIIREGDGTIFPKKGQKLSMHYKGTLASDGTKVGFHQLWEPNKTCFTIIICICILTFVDGPSV
jgi:hypothetical protein